MTNAPLAERIRPTTVDEVVGQRHILAPGASALRDVIDAGTACNMIFYGPPGTGKTTVANIVATRANRPLHRLNATSAGVKDVRAIVDAARESGGAILYLDEIQCFSKKQQQSLLEHTESGLLTLIASTTENPYFYVYDALLSRSAVFEFRPVTPEEAVPAVERAILARAQEAAFTWDDGIQDVIARVCGGDVRRAINVVELVTLPALSGKPVHVTAEKCRAATRNNNMRFDADGDENYDLASGLHKSMRGSDPDAALHYLARLLAGGDIVTPSRRVLCAASEDVGLAYPPAIQIATSCVDAAFRLGLPEAYLPLAQAVLTVALAPKSNSVHEAFAAARADVESGVPTPVPRHLQNCHADSAGQEREQGYLYPHDYPGHYVAQQYLPDAILGRTYYRPGDNPTERAMFDHLTALRASVETERR